VIGNGPKPLAPSSGVVRSGVNLAHGPTLAPSSLIKGQMVEGVVVQLVPRLLVETASSVFSAAASSASHTLGERLLFRVLDADVQPPRLELLRSLALSGSLLAQQSVFLRSLLYRPNSLEPLQQWLSNASFRTKLPSPLAALLQSFWQLHTAPKPLDIKNWLLMSGLFSESRGQSTTLASATMGPAKAHNDLKALLKLLALEEGLAPEVKPLLEALHSSQIKGLDALLSHQLYYQWLMPWLDQQHVLITLAQTQQQHSQKQWSISLTHEGPDLGFVQINMLLTQSMGSQEAQAKLHFATDTQWLADLVNGSGYKLCATLKAHGIHVHQVSVGPKVGEEVKVKPEKNHTILDVHV